ncbi:hypothetical protein V6N13_015122 [Hibiscus sabdariffa]
MCKLNRLTRRWRKLMLRHKGQKKLLPRVSWRFGRCERNIACAIQGMLGLVDLSLDDIHPLLVGGKDSANDLV